MESLIDNISDTAKWVAAFRAEESERLDAIFNDPFARKLAGEKGFQIANAIKFLKDRSWMIVSRTFLFDSYIHQQIEDGCKVVVNLAAGLDSRPYRMDLPLDLEWIEVDLPEILNYKKNILSIETPKCKLERFDLDLSNVKERNELFNLINKRNKRTLIITEGLLMYLTSEQVASLARDLSAQSNFKRWVIDLFSPGRLAASSKEINPYLEHANSSFKFGPPEGEGFFQPFGWNHIESKSSSKTAALLNRLTPEMAELAHKPEPPGPKLDFPWTGICLFENAK